MQVSFTRAYKAAWSDESNAHLRVVWRMPDGKKIRRRDGKPLQV